MGTVKRKKLAVVALTYLDTQHPDTVLLTLKESEQVMASRTRMSIPEAADLSQRLAEAVRAHGYEMKAVKRLDRR